MSRPDENIIQLESAQDRLDFQRKRKAYHSRRVVEARNRTASAASKTFNEEAKTLGAEARTSLAECFSKISEQKILDVEKQISYSQLTVKPIDGQQQQQRSSPSSSNNSPFDATISAADEAVIKMASEKEFSGPIEMWHKELDALKNIINRRSDQSSSSVSSSN